MEDFHDTELTDDDASEDNEDPTVLLLRSLMSPVQNAVIRFD